MILSATIFSYGYRTEEEQQEEKHRTRYVAFLFLSFSLSLFLSLSITSLPLSPSLTSFYLTLPLSMVRIVEVELFKADHPHGFLFKFSKTFSGTFYISKFLKHSASGEGGLLEQHRDVRVGDRILAINGESTEGKSKKQVRSLLDEDTVVLRLQWYVRGGCGGGGGRGCGRGLLCVCV